MSLSEAEIERLKARPLTPRMRRYLTIVAYWWTAYGYGPTLRELGRTAGGVSAAAAKEAVEKLRILGYVDWVEGKTRTLRVVGSLEGEELPPVPLAAKVDVIPLIRCELCGCEHAVSPEAHAEVCSRYQSERDC